MVKNKSHVEGSICETYLSMETSHFCSYYFEPHVQSMRTKVSRNDFGGQSERSHKTLYVFNYIGRSGGTCNSRYLDEKELAVVHLHVLLNCEDVQPYIE